MNRIIRMMLLIAMIGWTLFICCATATAQKKLDPEDVRQYVGDHNLIASFLERYGYKKYELVGEGDEKVIKFMVMDEKREQVYVFFVMLISEGAVMKIECRLKGQTPLRPKRYVSLLEKINTLNNRRTIGKYSYDKDENTVRYFYYRTLTGGLCFADFRQTLRMFLFIAFQDLKEIRELLS